MYKKDLTEVDFIKGVLGTAKVGLFWLNCTIKSSEFMTSEYITSNFYVVPIFFLYTKANLQSGNIILDTAHWHTFVVVAAHINGHDRNTLNCVRRQNLVNISDKK